jgi:replication-associated recombination protein RarA
MMPKTKNGHPALLMVSAMQKAIRRGEEEHAMGFACELMHSSKAYFTMVCNRLLVIAHEDLDTAKAPQVLPFVHAAIADAQRLYPKKPENPGGARMAIGNAIRLMCRSPKSREGDHFQAAIGLRNLLDKYVPEVPDYAFDKHTTQGKRMGRGIEHFRHEGARLVERTDTNGNAYRSPFIVPEDRYADRAYAMWALRDERAKSGNLFGDDASTDDGEV